MSDLKEVIYKQEAYGIIGKCMEVQLGSGFLEIVYKGCHGVCFSLRKHCFPERKRVFCQV